MAFRNLSGMRRKVCDGFSLLKGSPKDLYVLFLLKVLESYGYFSISALYTILLTSRFDIGDFQAGLSYGVWGGLISGYTLIFAPLIDRLGVKKSLLMSFALSAVGRLGLAFATSRRFLYFVLYGPIAMGNSVGIPVMVIGIKKLTRPSARSVAFSLFYTLMNVAAFLVGPTFDFFRITFINGFKAARYGPQSTWNDGLRLMVLLGSATSVVGFLVSCCVRGDDYQEIPAKESGSEGEVWAKEEESESKSMLAAAPRSDARRRSSDSGEAWRRSLDTGEARRRSLDTEEARRRSLDTGEARTHVLACPSPHTASRHPRMAFLMEIWDALKTSNARKFLLFCMLTVNLKQIFRHMDATLPKYNLRSFGCLTPIGLLSTINSFMIIVLVPFVGALTPGVNHFDMIHFGSYLSGLSAFWMVAFHKLFASALFLVFLSLGEAIWSPRWYDYCMWIAPNGKEGLYTAMASAPMFLAKLPTGILSGKLLEAFCPDNYECHKSDPPPPGFQPRGCDGRKLWAVVGCVTMATPIGLTLFQRWLRVLEPEHGSEPKRSGGPKKGIPIRASGRTREIEMFDAHEGSNSDLEDLRL